ncbi:MAG: MarR family winged helix-turn-helix transcriptional regulator, partial [Clostridium saudiense]|nr:MarR family winged helix-turn-helix transcriptional regulator [Clostridium saudiense]
TNKLLQKELIKKEFSPNGNNEILISLTRQGEIAFENHLTFHNEMIQQISMLAIDLPEESLEIIKKMLNTIDKILDTY